MSGPKYSYAKVDTERLRKQIAEMEAKVENAKCENIKRKISAIIKKTEGTVSSNSIEFYSGFIAKAEAILTDSKSLDYFKTLLAQYIKLNDNKFTIIGNSNQLLNIQQQYELRDRAISNIISMLKTYRNNVEGECNKALTDKKETEYINADWKGVTDSVSTIPTRLLKVYNELLNEILYCENFENIKNDIDSIINNHTVDDEYKVKQMKIRIEAAKIQKEASTDVIEYLQLKNDYVSLCDVLQKPLEIVPIEIEELRNKVSEMEKELKEITMMQYVSESLKHSMENLGYDIIGHEEVKTSNQAIDKNYFDFATNSMVNVSTSKNGAVLFEVMGKHSDLTDEQKTSIQDDMERFCPDYADVKAELSKYGITLERENLYPADIKYVRGGNVENSTSTVLRRKNNKKELGMMQNE